MALRPLTAELDDKNSPVRRFLDERFTVGLRDVQRRYRQAAPSQAVMSADRREANPGTVGTAADWLLRFLLHPTPSLALAAAGADLVRLGRGVHGHCSVARLRARFRSRIRQRGRLHGAGQRKQYRAEELARACWALALLTEMFRNPMAAINAARRVRVVSSLRGLATVAGTASRA